MKTQRIFIAFVLLSGLLLAACRPAQPTTAPEPVAKAPAPVTAPAVALNCQDQAILNDGLFRAENNTWGKGSLTEWSQCIGLHTNDVGTLAARWTWDWPISGNNVKSYPEIIFGQKPGSQSTTGDLPKQVSSLSEVLITYEFTSTHTGSGNLAFDFWLTDTGDPITWGVPPIKTEIMIWLESYGSMAPGGNWQERVYIDGVEYSVYTAKNWGDGWDYIAFVQTKPPAGKGRINLVSFLTYMKSKDLITGEEYVASVEFGNEVVGGKGETHLNQLTVSVR